MQERDSILSQWSDLSGKERISELEMSFGNRLIVEHSAIDIVCREGGVLIRPTVGIAFDGATNIIMSASLTATIPDYLAVMAQAFNGYRDLKRFGISAIPGEHVYLSANSGIASNPSPLNPLMQKSKFILFNENTQAPVFGGLCETNGLLGIGQYCLMPQYTESQPETRVHETEQRSKVTLTMSQAQRLVNLAVRAHNEERLTKVSAYSVLGTIKKTRNAEPIDWLSLGLGVFKEAYNPAPF